MLHIIPAADERTEVLLVHAPYPGRLKFAGVPGSLLAAIAPFLGAEPGSAAQVGLLDPGEASESFYFELAGLLRCGAVRVVCISTSTAAIEETARIARTVRASAGETVLVIVGGPHEDGCDEKVASRLDGVDLSVAGDGGPVLAFVLQEFLGTDVSPRVFCEQLSSSMEQPSVGGGGGSITSPWWGEPATRPLREGTSLSRDFEDDRAWPSKAVRFSVFDAPSTLPVMVSRGCSYGRCTFCAEALPGRRHTVASSFDWLEELADANPGAALYFQDSIFPTSAAVRRELLPLLSRLGRAWGCQVYLPTLSQSFLDELVAHGCSYIYTGLESASSEVLAAIGKPRLSREMSLERLSWTRGQPVKVGISLMFGTMSTNGELLETTRTIEETVQLARELCEAGVSVAGFYPNVQTVLPGTALARGLSRAGVALDFYRAPRCEAFAEFEDGVVGHNFMTLLGLASAEERLPVAKRVVEAASELRSLGELPARRTLDLLEPTRTSAE